MDNPSGKTAPTPAKPKSIWRVTKAPYLVPAHMHPSRLDHHEAILVDQHGVEKVISATTYEACRRQMLKLSHEGETNGTPEN